MRDYLEKACEEIDAAIFSGDSLYDAKALAEFKEYLERWIRATQSITEELKTEM